VCTKCGAGRRAARDEVVLREEKAGEKEKVTSGRQVSAQAEADTLPAAHGDSQHARPNRPWASHS
jgi:hypothetical protein